jgi:hypothetical protein
MDNRPVTVIARSPHLDDGESLDGDQAYAAVQGRGVVDEAEVLADREDQADLGSVSGTIYRQGTTSSRTPLTRHGWCCRSLSGRRQPPICNEKVQP